MEELMGGDGRAFSKEALEKTSWFLSFHNKLVMIPKRVGQCQ